MDRKRSRKRMISSRNSSLCDRETACIRQKCEQGGSFSSVGDSGSESSGTTQSRSASMSTSSRSVSVCKSPTSVCLESVTCPCCSHVFNQPVKLLCGHVLCRRCVSHLMTTRSKACVVCSVPLPAREQGYDVQKLLVDETTRRNVLAIFPMYERFNQVLQLVSEKHMWFQLHQLRKRLLLVREELVAVRTEKQVAHSELKAAFFKFIRTAKKTSALKKPYDEQSEMLRQMQACADRVYPLTPARCASFAKLPSHGCCLAFLHSQLEQAILRGADTLAVTHSWLEDVVSGCKSFPVCTACGGEVWNVGPMESECCDVLHKSSPAPVTSTSPQKSKFVKKFGQILKKLSSSSIDLDLDVDMSDGHESSSNKSKRKKSYLRKMFS